MPKRRTVIAARIVALLILVGVIATELLLPAGNPCPRLPGDVDCMEPPSAISAPRLIVGLIGLTIVIGLLFFSAFASTPEE